MGYKQPNNPMKMMKSALKMHKAEKKAGMHRDSAMYMNSPMYKGHSPMEMGHSPMEMGHDSPAKKYDSPMHKEESRELKDMPIVDIEKGKAKGDMKKGSPAKAAKPDYIDIDGDGDKSESMKEAAKDKKKGSPAEMKDKKDRVYSGGRKLPKGPKDKKDGTIGKDTPGKPPKGPRIGPGGRPPKRDAREEQPKSKREYGKGSPAKKYDRVVLGGNKGDKSKTKPGKKDYEK